MIEILVTEYNLTTWLGILKMFPDTKIHSTIMTNATYHSYQGHVTISNYREVIRIEGAIASYILLKHPTWPLLKFPDEWDATFR